MSLVAALQFAFSNVWLLASTESCIYDMTSADVCLQMGCTTAEMSKYIMRVQITVAVMASYLSNGNARHLSV